MKDTSSNLTLESSQRNRFWQRIGPLGHRVQGSNPYIPFPVVVIPALNYSCESFGAWKEDKSISFLRISMALTTFSSISCCISSGGETFEPFGETFLSAFSKIFVIRAMGISSNSLLPANWEMHQRLDLGGSLCPCILFLYKVWKEFGSSEYQTRDRAIREIYLLRVSVFQEYFFWEKRSFPDLPLTLMIKLSKYVERIEEKTSFLLEFLQGSKDPLQIFYGNQDPFSPFLHTREYCHKERGFLRKILHLSHGLFLKLDIVEE